MPRNFFGWMPRPPLQRQPRRIASDLNDSAILCETYYARGLTYQTMEDHERAIPDFDSVLEADPTNSSALQARAYSYLRLGKTDLASKDVERAAQLSPDDLHVYELKRRIHEAASIDDVTEEGT